MHLIVFIAFQITTKASYKDLVLRMLKGKGYHCSENHDIKEMAVNCNKASMKVIISGIQRVQGNVINNFFVQRIEKGKL